MGCEVFEEALVLSLKLEEESVFLVIVSGGHTIARGALADHLSPREILCTGKVVDVSERERPGQLRDHKITLGIAIVTAALDATHVRQRRGSKPAEPVASLSCRIQAWGAAPTYNLGEYRPRLR